MLPFFEVALVFVRLNQVASVIVNADDSMMSAAAKFCVVNRVAD